MIYSTHLEATEAANQLAVHLKISEQTTNNNNKNYEITHRIKWKSNKMSSDISSIHKLNCFVLFLQLAPGAPQNIYVKMKWGKITFSNVFIHKQLINHKWNEWNDEYV